MEHSTSRLPVVFVVAGVVLAAGCDDSSMRATTTSHGSFDFAPPPALLQSRAVDRTRLMPEVTIVEIDRDPLASPRVIPMSRDGERWRGAVDVEPERDYTFSILWVETVSSISGEVRDLPLARLRRTVPVGSGDARLEAGPDEYDLELDFDADGVSNLAERGANTDPFGDGFIIGPPTSADIDVVIPRIAPEDAPGIDGRNVVAGGIGVWLGEWANAVSFDTAGERLFIDRLMIDNGTDESPGQAFRAWSAMHDGEYLYVLVVVEDAGQRVRDEDRGPDQPWRDDSLEVYIDGDNSKRTSYGDGNDSNRLLPLLALGTTDEGVSTGIVVAELSADVPIRIDFATGPGAGPDGLRRPDLRQDVYELRIVLESTEIVPGRPFGFELQVNDDDNGGDREAKWGWAHPARVDEDVDFTFMDPSLMGTAILE